MADLATCGYIQGLGSLPLTCLSGYCGFNSLLGAAGCCDSTISVGETYSLTDCSYITACYAATDIAECVGDCAFNTRDLLCSDPASPECVKYTFTDISSAALFCSDQATVIDIAVTSEGAVETGSLSASPAGAGPMNAIATHTTSGAGSFTSSYIPPATTTPSRAATTTTSVATTSSAAAAGPQNPFTQTQASGTRSGGVGSATPTAKGACGKNGVSRVLGLLGCFTWGWALVAL